MYLETSNVSWSGESTTVFVANRGGLFGGGVMAALNSRMSCADGATSIFSRNSARNVGGAILLDSGSSVAFSGNSLFDGNSATYDSDDVLASGGAIYLRNSTATWDGLMSFTENQAGQIGGAISAIIAAIWCSGETKVLSNTAGQAGGGISLIQSKMSWDGEMELLDNTATSDELPSGGGILLLSSEVSWTGRTTVKDNHAVGDIGYGGGLAMYDGSVLPWTGDTEFIDNTAYFGGAISILNVSRASWGATSTTFTNNSAVSVGGLGGGLFISGSSEVSWSGHTEYSGNSALSAGAVFVHDGSSVGWTGPPCSRQILRTPTGVRWDRPNRTSCLLPTRPSPSMVPPTSPTTLAEQTGVP